MGEEGLKYFLNNSCNSRYHYWIINVIICSFCLTALSGAQLHRRALVGLVVTVKIMGFETKASSADFTLSTADLLLEQRGIDKQLQEGLSEIEMQSGDIHEFNLNPGVQLTNTEMVKVNREMDSRQILLDKATHLLQETIKHQDEYMRELRVKKVNLYKQLESISKKRKLTKIFLKEAKHHDHQSVKNASQSLKLYHIFNRRIKGFWNNFLYFLKATFAMLRCTTWGKNQYAMTLVESLRWEPEYAVADIKQKMAVEEIFMMASRRGHFEDVEIDLLHRLTIQRTPNQPNLSTSEYQNIDDLAESFMLRHLHHESFAKAKEEWIKEMSISPSDIDKEARLMMLKNSNSPPSDKDEHERLIDVVRRHYDTQERLHKNVARLDQIVSKIYDRQALDAEDRRFLLKNIEQRFKPTQYDPESSLYTERLTGIWNELLKNSKEIVPRPTHVRQIEFNEAAMKEGSKERSEIVQAIIDGEPIENLGLESCLTQNQLNSLNNSQSELKQLKEGLQSERWIQIRSNINDILSQAKTPEFKSQSEFFILKRAIYRDKLEKVMESLVKKLLQFRQNGTKARKDLSKTYDWYIKSTAGASASNAKNPR